MRAMLAKSMGKMRMLRMKSISEGKSGPEKEEYKKEVVCAASFMESLWNEDRIKNVIGALIDAYNGDPALARYDSTQEAWWAEQGDGAAFIRPLHILSAYCLRGAACGPEDTAHVLQIIKHLNESGDVRSEDDFILPAYGGLGIPQEYLGPLLASMTGNRHLLPNSAGVALDLDWYPDDSEDGLAETTKVLDAAAKLGFHRIMFRMPAACSYELLYKKFEVSAMQTDGGIIGSISCRDRKGEGKPETLFQHLELGDKKLSEVKDSEFVRTDDLVFYKTRSTMAGACIDSVGFAERMLFTAAEGELSASGGIYFARNSGNKAGRGVLEIITEWFCATRMLGDNKFSIDGLSGMLDEVASKRGAKALTSYATVKDSKTEDETDFEGVEEDGG